MTSDLVKKVKDVWDIVDEIKRHVTLTKKGQNFVGLCPFHSEKSPSFYVSPMKKIFHCFGCGENGDVISFVMKHEQLSFKEVMVEKANELGLPHQFNVSSSPESQLDHIREFLQMLQLKYSKWLEASTDAKAYCQKRKLTNQSIQTFGIGYSPSHQIQKQWLVDNQLNVSGAKSGLFHDDAYPLFTDRLMFPIHNARGILVGFSGRTIGDAKAKYINSSESPFFSKKKLLYGMHLAKKQAAKVNRIIVVEGHLDVIAMHEHGFFESVAVMGTALTPYHANAISKYCANVVLLFDSDQAGQLAIKKSLPALQSEALNIQVAHLSDKDPADYFLTHTHHDMQHVLDKSPHYLSYFIDKYSEGLDPNNPAKKSEVLTTIIDMLTHEKNQVVVDHYKQRIIDNFGVSKHVVESLLIGNVVKAPSAPAPQLKPESKYKKSEDMVVYFLLSNIGFRRQFFSQCKDLVGIFIQEDIVRSFETDLVDYDLIEKINHFEIKNYLVSLIIKFSGINLTYTSEEMEEYYQLLTQGKYASRVKEIKGLLPTAEGEAETILLKELSELIKKIK